METMQTAHCGSKFLPDSRLGRPPGLMAWAVRGPGLDGLRTWLGALPSPSRSS